MIEGSYGESGHDEKCEWASEACGCDSRKLLRAEIAVATKELTRLSVEIVRAERERDEARLVIREFLASGVEHDDPRMDYITMQVDRVTIAAARAAGEGGEDE